MIAAAGYQTGKSLLPEAWGNWLTMVHLTFTIVGEVLFVLASCAGAMFIIQNSLLKHKKLSSTSRILPSLSDLDNINHLCLLWGFPILTMGIIAGAVFARFTWKAGWSTDSKNYLDTECLDYLRISSASTSRHRLERFPDGCSFLRRLYSLLVILYWREILFYNFA